jgi:putative transposase
VEAGLMTFRHYGFKEYLKARGQQAMCEVVEVSEAYTSKTCSYCGTQHKIGSRKV